MTENESIEFMLIEKECINRDCDRDCAKCDIVQTVDNLNHAYNTAIKALEEIQQYRAIGTVEECRAAAEKQMARKPLIGTNMMTKKKYKVCPKCGDNLINNDYLYFYCDMCGQKLDWSDKE